MTEKHDTKGVKLSLWTLLLLMVSLLVVGGAAGAFIGHQMGVSPRPQVTDTQSTSSSASTASHDDKTPEDESGLPEGLVTRMKQAYSLLSEHYINDLDNEKLIEGALKGMVSAAGDPFTEYLNAEETKSLNNSMESSFEGIGATVETRNGKTVIVSPIDGAPAEKAGLLPEDIVLKIDGVDITGWSTTQSVQKIRGEKGTSVTLTIQRGDKVFDITIVRDTIPIHSVTSKLDENNPTIGYVRVSSFAETTYEEIVTQVENLRAQGATSFVFDVRSNPGGLLDQALKISNMFVEDGKDMMQIEQKNSEPQLFRASLMTYGSFKITEPVVLLVNEGSASASEILAAAMQESTTIPLIGVKTYGKGTVQTIRPLSDDTTMKVTTAKWLTPNGNWIHEQGITPGIVLEQPAFYKFQYVDATSTFEVGANGNDVMNIQDILKVLGYNVSVTGVYSEETANAVRQLERAAGLPETGVVTGQTALVINEQFKNYVQDNDAQYLRAIEEVKKLSNQ